MKKILFVIGTRPEAIKMAPVINACRQHSDRFITKICVTGQHKEMLDQVMQFFQLQEDYNLALMKPGQTLFDITADGLRLMEQVLDDCQPHLVMVQGDTTTVFVGALAAFYRQIPVAHIEAGLRSHNKYSPFPEEANRRLTSVLTDFHFAPTQKASDHLLAENIRDNVFVVGNTVIDALLWGVQQVRNDAGIAATFHYLDLSRRIILITAHRRESFGAPFEQICSAIAQLAAAYPDVQFVYPVHLNPNVQQVVRATLSGFSNIFLVAPLAYPSLIWLMDRCYFVITDSGGIQEEAPTLGKPVLVVRNVTEREEGVAAGTAKLVGTSAQRITEAARQLLDDTAAYEEMSKAVNPYGTGNSAQQIADILIAKL